LEPTFEAMETLKTAMKRKSKLSPIIVALDVDTKREALQWVKRLSPGIDIFKVGLQLFSKEGGAVVDAIIAQKKRVFLDLKLHDIPNTVSHAVTALVRPGIEFLTIHASGGTEMMEAAVRSVKDSRAKNKSIQTRILAVTVLTSLDDDDLREMGVDHSTAGQVLNLSRLAKSSGVDGIVSSPQEIRLLKAEHGKNLVLVTPGVRLDLSNVQDQKRVMTPSMAVQEGSDFLVMGRTLLEASDPLKTLKEVLASLSPSKKRLS
jgi:orotidine-5'-phosphate decarboxylase